MSGAPNDVQVTSSGTTTIHTLPSSNPAGTSDSVALPMQGVTDGVPVPVSAVSLPLPIGAATDGTDGTGITPPPGAAGIRGWLSGIYSKLSGSIAVTGTFWQATQPISAASLPLPFGAATSTLQSTINTTLGSPAQDGTDAAGVTQLAGGAGIRGWLSGIFSKLSGALTVTNIITNPTSTLIRPANITAYAQGNLVASNTTAGSIAVPSITAARVAGGNFMIRRLRLATNVTTGWDQSTFTIRLWSAPPTYINGDGGAYAVATGAAGFLGAFNVVLSQFGDGACGIAASAIGSEAGVALASGQSVYWDLQYTGSAAPTPASGQIFTLTAEDFQN